MLDDLLNAWIGGGLAENCGAHLPRLVHQARFVGVEVAGLAEDFVGHAEDTHVVEQRGNLDCLALVVRQVKLGGPPGSNQGNSQAV